VKWIQLPPTVLFFHDRDGVLHWLWPITTLISLRSICWDSCPCWWAWRFQQPEPINLRRGDNPYTFSEPDKLSPMDCTNQPDRDLSGYMLVLIGVWILLGSLSPALVVILMICAFQSLVYPC